MFAGGGGADIGPLKQIGAALAGLSPDSQRYFDLHHAATDTFEAVSKRELHLGAVNMTALIYLVDKYGLILPKFKSSSITQKIEISIK